MNAAATNTGLLGHLKTVIVYLVVAVALYYLYQYFYSSSGGQGVVLLAGKNKADETLLRPDGKTALNPITTSALPGIYEGGQFSVEFWIYISNWNVKLGKNKHIFSLGGQNFDTIRIYLAPFKSDLRVRVHTKEVGQVLTETSMINELPASNRQDTFNNLNVDSQLTNPDQICDIADLDLQRWLHVVVTVSNRTVDTYLDGKLARSCVLPTFYKVDNNYMANILQYGGFGGYVSNVTVYDYSLSPDIVYHNYMSGPTVQAGSILDWLKSFFVPGNPDVNV